MSNTIIQQGSFTSDGNARIISLRSDVDWMRVYNITELQVQNNVGFEWYWQRELIDFAIDTIQYQKVGGTDAVEAVALANGEFRLIDSSAQTPTANVAVVGTTNAVAPVITVATTAGVSAGTIVRLNSIVNAENISGFDFEVDNVLPAGPTFDMRYPLANAPGAAGGVGFYRIIPFDPIFYPRNRYIVGIGFGAQTDIAFSVTHGYTVGQELKFLISSEFGTIEMNELSGTVTAVNLATNEVTVDINSNAFTAFTIPLIANWPFTWAQAVPVGMDTAEALTNNVNILADSRINLAILGIELSGGQGNPGGANNDQVTWVAGKSFNL